MSEVGEYEAAPEADACPRCKARGKTWRGGDPKCAFKTGVFDSDNWNCATANAIREIAEPEEWGKPLPHYIHLGGFDDQHAGVIDICRIGEPPDPREYDWLGEWLVWSSYKHHGQFEAMWIVDRDKQPHRPSLGECERIIAYFADENLAVCEGCKKKFVIRESYAKIENKKRFCGWRCEGQILRGAQQ